MPKIQGYETFGNGGFTRVWVDRLPAAAPLEQKFRSSARGGLGFLIGIAATFSKCHFGSDGGVEVFWPGCFDLALSRKSLIRLLFDHSRIDGIKATTADGLHIISSDTALGFALPLDSIDAGAEIAATVKGGQRLEVSTSYRVLESEVQIIKGTPIKLLKSVGLEEISLVSRAACPGTTASLVDAEPDLAYELKSGRLAAEAASHSFRKALRTLAAA